MRVHKNKLFKQLIILLGCFTLVYFGVKNMNNNKFPKLNKEEIINIYFDSYYSDGENIQLDKNEILNYYNHIKVVDNKVGTTADCAIFINLANGNSIVIEPMYYKSQISIRYQGESEVYQRNAISKQFSDLFDTLSR